MVPLFEQSVGPIINSLVAAMCELERGLEAGV